MSLQSELSDVSSRLSDTLCDVAPVDPVTHIYDPTRYAVMAHRAFLAYARIGIDALLLGMNPGPWGMAQTGVPFGEVAAVREFLGINAEIGRPDYEHPKRPVTGLFCTRSEVSGRRLWGWAQSNFGTCDAFFEHYFVWNWCPLAFLEESGRNRTPDKLPPSTRQAIEDACDQAIIDVVDLLQPRSVVGVGAFASKRARRALAQRDLPVHQILHPSPASPAANRGWQPQIEAQLESLGLPASAGVKS
ncbi:MAG: single-stranded DNA-binding protein [Phycisphaerales bacterium]|nr:single-stranded DNA-binding protein [Phycisphaerales bacterium]